MHELPNKPLAVETSWLPLASLDDRILNIHLDTNCRAGEMIPALNAQLSEQWIHHGWSTLQSVPSFPLVTSTRKLTETEQGLIEQLWEGLFRAIFEQPAAAHPGTYAKHIERLLPQISARLGNEWRDSVRWLIATLSEVQAFGEQLEETPLRGVLVGGFDYYYTIPLESCFPMIRGEKTVDDNLGTLNLYTCNRISAEAIEGIAHAGRMLLEPLRMLEVLADRERKDWETMFSHIRHNLDKGVRMIRSETKTIRRVLESGQPVDPAHIDVIQGSIGMQKSLYDALEAYATITRSYSSGMIARSSEILRDKSTFVNIGDILVDCMQEATCRRLFDIKYAQNRFGVAATYDPKLDLDAGTLLKPYSLPALILLFVELLVNANKYVVSGTPIEVKAQVLDEQCIVRIKNRSNLIKRLETPDESSPLPLCKDLSGKIKCSSPRSLSVAGIPSCQDCVTTWMKQNILRRAERLALGEGSGVGLSQLTILASRVLGGHLQVGFVEDAHEMFPYVVEAVLTFEVEKQVEGLAP